MAFNRMLSALCLGRGERWLYGWIPAGAWSHSKIVNSQTVLHINFTGVSLQDADFITHTGAILLLIAHIDCNFPKSNCTTAFLKESKAGIFEHSIL